MTEKVVFQRSHSQYEAREIIIGQSATGRLLLVSFTEREINLVRIISARPATNRERDDYEKSQHF